MIAGEEFVQAKKKADREQEEKNRKGVCVRNISDHSTFRVRAMSERNGKEREKRGLPECESSQQSTQIA